MKLLLVSLLVTNRFSAGLIVLNIVLFLLAFKNADYFDLNLHFEYQPIFAKVFLLLNFPAALIAGIAIIPLLVAVFGETDTTLELIVFLVASVMQWGLIGALLERLFSSPK